MRIVRWGRSAFGRLAAAPLAAVLLSAALLAAAAPLAAQGGSLRVTVRSQGGEPISGVLATDSASASTALSGDDGRLLLRLRSTTPAVVHLTHPGHVSERIVVPPLAEGAVHEVSLTLRPLYALDAVTVTTPRDRPLLDTTGASTGGAIEMRELAALPSDARDPLALALQIPGVAQATGFFGDAPPLTIAGGNALYSQYLVDGLDNNEGFLGGPRVELPLAALDRLVVHTSGYGADRGRSPDGIVEMRTRSGPQEWSGETFVVHRPGMPLDASPRFAPEGVDPSGFRRLQLGTAGGGPIPWRAPTFLFGALEYEREVEERIGSTARAAFLGSELRERWKLFARADHGWSERNSTTARIAASNVRRAGRGGGVIVPEADLTTRRIGSLAALTHRTATRNGAGANEASIQLGSFRWYFPPSQSDLETPQVIVVAPDLVTTQAIVGSSNYVFDETELQLQLRELFEYRFGAHELRLGADVVASRFDLTAGATNPQGVYTVVDDGRITPAGDLLSISDIPADVRVLRYQIDARPQRVAMTQTLWSAFVEDRWRVTPSLTLTLGARWDYDDITSRGASEPDLDNFQPRFAVNWVTGPASVLRAGIGRYTGKLPYAIYSDAVQFGPQGNAVLTFEGESHPPPAFRAAVDPSALDPETRVFPPREIRLVFERGIQQPEALQLTAGYQHQPSATWGLAADVVWVETRNLPRSWDLNAIARPLTPADTVHRLPAWGDQTRPVPPAENSFRRLTTTDSGGRARYLALQLEARRRFQDGWSATAS